MGLLASGEPSAATLAEEADVNSTVVGEVVKAYYPSVVASVDAARARAQTAYTIASAVATALVAAGVFGDVGDASPWVTGFGIAALLAWLAAAGLFMFAVAGRFDPPVTGDQANGSAFVRAVMSNARAERSKVGERSANALRMSIVAMAVTFVAALLAWFVPPESTKVTGRVVLGAAALDDLAKLCSTTPANPVAATFDSAKLTSEFVSLTLPAGSCGKAARTLRVHKAAILAATAPSGN